MPVYRRCLDRRESIPSDLGYWSVPTSLTPTYDLISHVTLFCRALRQGGLLVGPSETASTARALALVNILDKDELYWTLRTVLVSRADEIPSFDECFSRYWMLWLPGKTSSGPGPAVTGGPVRYVRRRSPAVLAGLESEGQQPPMVDVVRTGASPIAVEAGRGLTALHGDDLEEISSIAAQLVRALPSRPGRRLRRHRRKGVPNLRAALRLSLSQGGDLIILPRRRRVLRVPRFLLLLDVSGSMDRHAKLLLQLVYALAQRSGRVETFVFSTAITRVTREMKAPSFSEALNRVGNLVSHWSGGTRIGESLRSLNRDHAHLLDRDTTAFLLSDGWETGEPEILAREMASLRRQVRRLIWLDPMLGTPEYEQATLGLQAAAPYVDRFVSALDLAHLRRLPHLVRKPSPRPSATPVPMGEGTGVRVQREGLG